MKNEEWPKSKPEPLLHVDATPDENYALRILQAYRQNCNCKYEVHGLPKKQIIFWDMMNELQDQRAKVLDKAIETLTKKTEK